jgi:hypothetical protein
MVGRELAALLRFAEAAAAGGENDRRRLDHVLAAARAPATLDRPKLGQRRLRERGARPSLEGLAQRGRDREPGAVADLEQPLARRTAAAGEAIAPVLARELDPELLQPVDRGRRLAGQDLDEPAVSRLVRALPDILGMNLRRVVVAERRLDAALSLGGVAGLQRPF